MSRANQKTKTGPMNSLMRFFVVQRDERAAVIKWARNSAEAVGLSGLQDAVAIVLPLHSLLRTDIAFKAERIRRLKLKREIQVYVRGYVGAYTKTKEKANVG